MIIVLLLFFKSICLYCQRLVLHIHDRWINPKNVRLIREAAEAKGVKFLAEEYRQSKKSKKRRYTHTSAASSYSPSTAPSSLLGSLGRAESCRFCANTPQGYCRHHFHLQELQVHKQQQKIWCPLAGGFSSRSVEYKQLRKIKRELKRTLHPQQKEAVGASTSNASYQPVPVYEASSVNSYNDSGYQTISLDDSRQGEEEGDEILEPSLDSEVYMNLPTPTSVVETTYSFESCCETPPRPSSPALLRVTSTNSFVSCDSSTLSTSYL